MRLKSFVLLIFASISLNAKSLDVSVAAESAILINADTGAILYEKQAHVPSFPASTTKVATALFILDQKKTPYHQLVTVSAEALKQKTPKNDAEAPAYWPGTDGSKMGLVKGEVLSIDSLLHGLLLVSGNDAANVLAEVSSGSIPGFLEELNVYLLQLGCQNTQFRNPHGYHHPEHFTTAYDLGLITKKALEIPKFREIISTPSYMKPKSNKQPPTELRLLNPLMTPGRHYYPKAIGGKTGWHSKAKNTLIAAAEHQGRTLIAVLMGCEKRDARYVDATRLFETAFAEKKERLRLLGPEKLFSKEIPGANAALKAHLAQEVAIEFYPAEEPICKAFVRWDAKQLPIQKGQIVGEVQILNQNGIVIQKGSLVAQEEVKGTLVHNIKETFNKLFR